VWVSGGVVGGGSVTSLLLGLVQVAKDLVVKICQSSWARCNIL